MHVYFDNAATTPIDPLVFRGDDALFERLLWESLSYS